MKTILSRWFMFGLLIGWAASHTTLFAQPGATTPQLPASSAEKMRQALDKTVTIDYTGQSLQDVLNHFRDRTGLPVTVDHNAFLMTGLNVDAPIGQVELKAKNEKAGAVLRKLLNNYRLNYVIFEDSLLVTSDEMVVIRQMRQRVSVNVEDVPLKKVVRELAKNHGVNLVIDPKVNVQAEAAVSLQVDNTGIETAMRLLAEMASLKAVRMGNVMFITTPEKAKTIREEEAHQFDNPLNPNVPGMGIPPAFGMVGGFGGGMLGGIAAPPIRVAPAIPAQVAPPPIDLPEPPAPPVKAPAPKKVIPVEPQPALPPSLPPAVSRPPGSPPPAPRREP